MAFSLARSISGVGNLKLFVSKKMLALGLHSLGLDLMKWMGVGHNFENFNIVKGDTDENGAILWQPWAGVGLIWSLILG